MIRLKKAAIRLQKEKQFDMTHCRGYIGASIGLALKKKSGVKFFFDMRGFWADEKKDAGAWNVKNPLFRQVYKHYKKQEKQYQLQADFIISLTEAGKKEMEKWPGYDPSVPVDVIPCCADMSHFTLTSPEKKKNSRELLGLPQDKLVISYLGSVGSWYMLDEMLQLFRMIRDRNPGAVFLFITPSEPDYIFLRAEAAGLNRNELVIREAGRQEVPVFVAASDVNISFIKPVYSKLSSSPTKLGEVLAMGIPVISNSGVGDVEEIVKKTGGGIAIRDFSTASLQAAAESIPALLQLSPAAIREAATGIYDLGRGVEKYHQAYLKVLGE
ncbi:MAG: glycosyltransferase [Chitinophagaceae bacterium]|nr:glycosyltransferase [Chitinophagaceae bacterium]